MMCFFRLTLLILSLCFARNAAAADPDKVIWDRQVTKSIVGFDGQRQQWTHEGYFLVLLAGPSSGDRKKSCAIKAAQGLPSLVTAVTTLRREDLTLQRVLSPVEARQWLKAIGNAGFQVKSLPGPFGIDLPDLTPPPIPPDPTERNLLRLDAAFADLAASFQSEIALCEAKDGISLGIARRHCGRSDARCPAGLSITPTITSAHAQIGEWIHSRARQGSEYDDIVKLSTDKKVSVSKGATTIIRALFPTSFRRELEEFRAAVEKVRALRKEGKSTTLPAHAFLSVGLDDSAAIRIVDVADHPAWVGRLVKKSTDVRVPNLDQLGNLSDEIARSRLRECERYRGLSISSSQAAFEKCSGYSATRAEIMACLRGDRCIPKFTAGKSRADVLLLSEPVNFSNLRDSSLMPRVTTDLKSLVATSNECASSKDPSRCIASKMIPAVKGIGWAEKATNCLLEKRSPKAQCLASNLPEGPTADILRVCASGRNPADCTLQSGLKRAVPKEATRIIECAQKYPVRSRGFSQCLEFKALGSGELFRLTKCLDFDTSTSKGQLAAAVCITGSNIPPETLADAELALSCSSRYSGDYKAMAGCVLASKIQVSGDLGLIVQCYAQSGGSYASTAICLAGGNLNAEGKIILQCAESAPDATTFVGCAAGQLTAKELVNCKGKKFGEEPCFGQENVFRKLAKNVLGQDIGQNSVVAQAINHELDGVQLHYALAEAISNEGGHLLNNVGENVGAAAERAARAAERVVTGAASKATDPRSYVDPFNVIPSFNLGL